MSSRSSRVRQIAGWSALVVLASCRSSDDPAQASTQVAPRARRTAKSPLELERVSLTENGKDTTTCHALRPGCKSNSHATISGDGRLVAFDSDASNLFAGLPNPRNVAQIYCVDVQSHELRLISRGEQDGVTELGNGASTFADISSDGAWIAFGSQSSNLDPDDRDATDDVFVASPATAEVQRVSENPGGADLNGGSSEPAISADGRFVAFSSGATDFRPLHRPASNEFSDAPPAGVQNVFIKDRESGRYEWISAPIGGVPDNNSLQPAVSADGSRVVFGSFASNLVQPDTNDGELDVFVCDRVTGKIDCVSRTFSGAIGGNGVSRKPQISGNGRFVVFEGTATDLLPPGQDTNGSSDVFVRDLEKSSTVRVNVSAGGVQARGTSGYGAISFDGRYVAFTSTAANLAPGDSTHGFLDFFVRDRDVSGDGELDERGDVATHLMSQTPERVQSNAKSGGNADLSADGRFVVFMSEGSTLDPFDLNGVDASLPCTPKCPFGRDVFRARIY